MSKSLLLAIVVGVNLGFSFANAEEAQINPEKLEQIKQLEGCELAKDQMFCEIALKDLEMSNIDRVSVSEMKVFPDALTCGHILIRHVHIYYKDGRSEEKEAPYRVPAIVPCDRM